MLDLVILTLLFIYILLLLISCTVVMLYHALTLTVTMSSIVIRTHAEFKDLPPLCIYIINSLCASYSPSFFSPFSSITNHISHVSATISSQPLFIVPGTITWLSFDSIVSSFGSHFHAWPGGTVDFFAFKTSPFHHHLFSVLSPAHKTYYTNLAYFRLHLSCLHESFPSNPLTTPAHNV